MPCSARIFISYSRRGNGLAWKDRLLTQLAVFEKHNVLDVWHDDETKLGDDWHTRINTAMRSARLAVLLLTDEFLKSPFVLQHELPELQRRHKEEGLIVAPILCEKCNWETNPWLALLQIKPREQATPVPLASLSQPNRDHVLRQLATEIAVELCSSALAELSALHAPDSALGEIKTYLEKFSLTRSTGQPDEKLIGREQELALLDLAFAQSHTAIVSLVAWGGVGKTMLVQHWLRRLESGRIHKDDPPNPWFGTRRVYAWSFYSQGTKEDRQASEDTFLAHALEWFGVQCEPTLSPWDKGRLLADAVARERTLLILDGIEPLQYPPGPMGGQLRAPGVQSLLKQLARKSSAIGYQQSAINNALCLVTTREPLTDLADFQRREGSPWGSVLRVDLGNLTDEAGAALLHHAGASRAGAAEIKPDDKELLAASHEVDGHALTLNLLGRFLARTRRGDIRQRDLVKFEEADRAVQGGTTFKMLAAFENWFAIEGDIEARSLTILRLLGLFDRPADEGCMAALRKSPIIAGLTEPLFTLKRDSSTGQTTDQPLSDKAWNDASHFLVSFGLVVIQADGESLLDCHPLIREFFSERVRERSPNSWRSAHFRLYEYLSFNSEYQPVAFEQMLPLFQAIVHGCRAGQHQTMCDLYYKRVLRGDNEYSWKTVGTIGLDMATISLFFEVPWTIPCKDLSENDRGWVMNQASLYLRDLGRITESFEPIRSAIQIFERLGNWENAATSCSNLSDGELTVGNVANAYRIAEIGFPYAERSSEDYWVSQLLCDLGNASHQADRCDEAEDFFKKAEIAMAKYNPDYPMLYGIQDFHYCEVLLVYAEQLAWKNVIGIGSVIQAERLSEILTAVQRRAKKMISRVEFEDFYLDIGMEYLTISRSLLYDGIIGSRTNQFSSIHSLLNKSLQALSRVNVRQWLVCAFLTQTWLNTQEGNSDKARDALDEAWDIAERGPMQLHMADIYLYRARLFFREKVYPWNRDKDGNPRGPADDLAAAEKLINKCGYHRRDRELADAKYVILGGQRT